MGDRDLLAAEEGLFTGEARAGEGPGPEPLPGAMDDVEEAGGGRGLGWVGSVGGLVEAIVWWAEKRRQVKARYGPSTQQHQRTHDHTIHNASETRLQPVP